MTAALPHRSLNQPLVEVTYIYIHMVMCTPYLKRTAAGNIIEREVVGGVIGAPACCV